MSLPKHAPSSSASSVYTSHPASLANEYIHIASTPFKGDNKSETFTEDESLHSRPSLTYLPPPFPPPGYDPSSNVPQPFRQKHRRAIAVALYIFVLILITVGFTAPVVYFTLWKPEENDGVKDLRLPICTWLLASWGFTCVSNIFINIFPYAFRLVARWVNPGQVKYWRIFRYMRLAVTLLGGAVGTYCSFVYVINNNKSLFAKGDKKPDPKSMDWDDILKNLAINANKKLVKPSDSEWQKIVNDVLTMLVVWACLFFVEKIAMLFVSIHYHYRADGVRIEEAKRRRNALVVLYKAAISLYPAYHTSFRAEDAIIRDEKSSGKGRGRLFAKLHNAGDKVIVDHALDTQRSSAALGKRIWMSLVPEGRNVLTVEDIIEVLGSHRRAEAVQAFKEIDTNDNGDITLSEMVLTVLETGRSRRMVYQGMTDINKAINTLDWILCVLIMMTVTVFGVVRYVPSLAKLRDAAGFAALGLTWGLGRSLYEFINGCIFIFFKHAYDVGDRIELYNITGMLQTQVTVKRISLLFTVFRRIDNGKDLQVSNERLNMKRIENVSRSGANREEVSVVVDFNTTFTDIQNLKSEIQAFLSSKENRRDYQPGCEVRVTSIYEMNKLEIKVGFTHKSNWSNEELRAARSSKFMCALVAAIRRIPMAKPGAIGSDVEKNTLFDPRTEEAAYRSLTAIPVSTDSTLQQNMGHTASGAEINDWIGQTSTGLRRRSEQGAGTIYIGT